MLWAPIERALVKNVAVPEARELEPIVVPPSLKVTVPVGVPDPGEAAETVAVNVTFWVVTLGLIEDATAVVVPARVMDCESAEDVAVR